MDAYSMDLRQRVLTDCDNGMKTRAVAQKYSVSESWVRRLKQRRRENGQVEPRSPRNNRKPKLDPYVEPIRQWIRATPDQTLEELRTRLKTELGVVVALGTLWNAISRLGLTVKKSPSGSRAGSPGREGETGAMAIRAIRHRPRKGGIPR
jgi:transposase